MQAKYPFQEGSMNLEDFRRKYPAQTMTLGNVNRLHTVITEIRRRPQRSFY